MTTIIPQWNILEDKGLGKIIGTIKTDFEDYSIYERRVRLIQSIRNQNNYGTILSKDIYSLKKNKFFDNEEGGLRIIYFGEDKFKAISSFNEIVEKDKKIKEKIVHKIFTKN